MKKKYLFISGAKKWNSLLRKFLNLHKRIKNGTSSEQQILRMISKLQSIYKRLEKMQYRVGIKLAGSALALMLISATSFSQDFSSIGNLSFTEDIFLQQRPTPVYADIDNDGDLDLYAGEYSGTINVFTNDGAGHFSAAGNLQADGINIDAGYFSTPEFADIDGDGDLDLYIGEWYGHIQVYTNDGAGTLSSAGNLQADGIDIQVTGHSVPVFEDLDGDGDLDLFLGGSSGYMYGFTNDGTGSFSYAGKLQADGIDIDVGQASSPEFADIDGDGDFDLYVGEYYGTVKIFTNDGTGTFSSAGNLQADGVDIDVNYLSIPEFADIDDDGDLDLFIGEFPGFILVFNNDGTGTFSAEGNMQVDLGEIDVGEYAAPEFADLDGDDDLDLYVGEWNGTVKVFINVGNSNFQSAPDLQADGVDIDMQNLPHPVFADIDGDEDLDLFIGDYTGNVGVFTNDGTGTFSSSGNLQADGTDIDVGIWSAPEFADIDSDSDLDLYVGEYLGSIKVYINNGSGTFSAAGNLQADGVDIDVELISNPEFADLDGDGDFDLYVGEYYGTVKIFTNDGTGTFSSAGNLQADGIDIDVGYLPAPVFASINGCTENLFLGFQDGFLAEFQGTDITDPTITCVDNQVVDADDTNTYTVVGTEFDPTEIDDNCGVAGVLNDFNNLATLNGAVLPLGTTTVIWTVTDDAGNEGTCSFDVLVNEYVSINDLSEHGIAVYPNPSRGIFTIETNDIFNVSVIDMTGKIVKEKIVGNTGRSMSHTLDLGGQTPGIYFINFKNDKTVRTIKIIIN